MATLRSAPLLSTSSPLWVSAVIISPSLVTIITGSSQMRSSQMRSSRMRPLFAASPRPQYFSSSSVIQNRKHVYKFWSSFGICAAEAAGAAPQYEEEDDDDGGCELVKGEEILIDGVDTYLLKPVKNNNGTAILLLSDVFGFQDSAIRDFAYRLACNGYNVVVPDLFRGEPWRKGRGQAEFEEWRGNQNQERAKADVLTTASWMASELVAAGVGNTKLGVLGFSYGGGQLMLDVLARDDEGEDGGGFGLFATGVSVYGIGMDRSSGRVKVPLLLVAGDSDPLCPLHVLRDVEKRVSANSSNSNSRPRVVIFKDRGHDFAHRPQTPQEDTDADKVFRLIKNWFFHALLPPTHY